MTAASLLGGASTRRSGQTVSPDEKRETAFFRTLQELESAIKKLESEVELAQLRLDLTVTETRLATEEEGVFPRETDEAYAQLRALEQAFSMKVRRDPSTSGKLHLRMTFPEDGGTVPPLKLVLDVNGEDLKVDICEPPVFLLDALLKETNLKNTEGSRAAFIATLRDKHKLYRSSTTAGTTTNN